MTTAILALSSGSSTPNPVNALSAPVRRYLQTSLRAAISNPNVSSILLVGRPDASGIFSAGADIHEFSSNNSSVTTSTPTLNDIAYLLESSPKPVVAALSGVCLGGGMELALACHYRVADTSLSYGLPEVQIGLLPGAGGTQRLPRLCGLRHALDVILRGRINCGSEEGLMYGFLDGIALEGETLLECGLRWANWAAILPGVTLESRRLCQRVVVPCDDEDKDQLCNFVLQSIPSVEHGGESVHAALKAIRASFELSSFQEGMKMEKNLFNDLLYHSLQGRAYRHIFFAERAAASSSKKKQSLQFHHCLKQGKGTIGVIGAGTMGRGIAISFLRAGYGPVILVDVNDKGLQAGVQYIRSILEGEAKKGRIQASKLDSMKLALASSTDLSKLADCDCIVEAVFENLNIKREIFTKLNTIANKSNALLLSNTSTLDVDAIASMLSPSRRPYCAGMHFFSPAHIMKLVEVVRGKDTSRETLDIICAMSKRIRKVPVVVGNCDGFVGNRMLHPYSSESTLLLSEFGGGEKGLTVADIDGAVGKTYFGMAAGPFLIFDIAGNDIGYNIRREKGLIRDPKTGNVGPNRSSEMRYTELPDELVIKLGRVGQKALKGWYDYDKKIGKGRKPLPSSEVQELINKYSMTSANRGKKLDKDEIVNRILFPLVNEGFKILEEGIATNPADIDIIYLYGYGFPAWKGGPMFWADNYVGLGNVLSKLEELHNLYPGSDYFRPSELLRKCVEMGVGVQEYYNSAGMKSKL